MDSEGASTPNTLNSTNENYLSLLASDTSNYTSDEGRHSYSTTAATPKISGVGFSWSLSEMPLISHQ